MSKQTTYRKNVARLRDELRDRKSYGNKSDTNINENHPPPGLKGYEIGLWYAQRNKRTKELEGVKENDTYLLAGPNISLSEKIIGQLREAICNIPKNTKGSLSAVNVQADALHKRKDFMELIKTKVESTENESSELDRQLYDEFVLSTKSEQYKKMLQGRQRLPSYQHRQEIVDLVKNNSVVLIAGNTGCGKTTQIAQYILDNALMNMAGSKTKIICTQPRRIAATSIAERVASERGEQVGNSVGYQIRLEKISPRFNGNILFCTTGVLLKFMETHPTLHEYSHIIVDEIHERNAVTDVCLALIKQIVQHRKSLKIILMSATLNEEKFAQYFSNCPIIHIEGFTYPVQELYLEDVLEETGFNKFTNKKKEPVWCQYKYKNQRRKDSEVFEMVVRNYADSLRGQYSETTINNLKNPETEKIDLKFIQHLINHISHRKPKGAILVILPGFSAISSLYENLQKDFHSTNFVIYPLHSLLTQNDQRNIFNKPPESVRKIILSTPLAETSITIDDVVYVINAGKMRRPFYDFDKGATVLEDEWITKANEMQRKGRAGRVQEGICYHLYTRARSSFFEAYESPEILRIRLEENLLTLKVLYIKDVKLFISSMIDVPETSVIDASIDCLQRLGALTDFEELTPLGLHIARLGVPPKIGKMLLLASIFSCFDPISSLSAGLSFRSPFYTVIGKEELCNIAKRNFSADSDQLAVANALLAWNNIYRDQLDFCYKNFLSQGTLSMLDRLKSQFAQLLFQSNFLSDPKYNCDLNNRHSKNEDLLKAVIVGGLYPNVAYRSIKIKRGKRIDVIKTAERKSLKLLPSSVNSDPSAAYDSGFLVFHELNKYTSNYFLTETTSNVSPYSILLFGDKIETYSKNNTHYISVGGIIQFRCNQETANVITELRNGLNQLLENKILESSPVVWDSSEDNLLTTILQLISTGNTLEDFNYDNMDDDDYYEI